MAKGDYDKFVDGIYYGEDATKEDISESNTMLKAMLTEKGQESIKEKGGVKSIEIVSEEISDDGKSAEVVLKQTYGNGDTEDTDFDMVLVKGKWMIEMDK